MNLFFANNWTMAGWSLAVYLLGMCAWWAFCAYKNGKSGHSTWHYDNNTTTTDWADAAIWGGFLWPLVCPIAGVVVLIGKVYQLPKRLFIHIFTSGSAKAHSAKQRKELVSETTTTGKALV